MNDPAAAAVTVGLGIGIWTSRATNSLAPGSDERNELSTANTA